MSKNKYNAYRYTEMYPDPTAGDAIEHIAHNEREARRNKHQAEVQAKNELLKPRVGVWRKENRMDEAYTNLSNAIIIQAARDYRKALKRLKEHPHDTDARGELKMSVSDFLGANGTVS